MSVPETFQLKTLVRFTYFTVETFSEPNVHILTDVSSQCQFHEGTDYLLLSSVSNRVQLRACPGLGTQLSALLKIYLLQPRRRFCCPILQVAAVHSRSQLKQNGHRIRTLQGQQHLLHGPIGRAPQGKFVQPLVSDHAVKAQLWAHCPRGC